MSKLKAWKTAQIRASEVRRATETLEGRSLEYVLRYHRIDRGGSGPAIFGLYGHGANANRGDISEDFAKYMARALSELLPLAAARAVCLAGQDAEAARIAAASEAREVLREVKR